MPFRYPAAGRQRRHGPLGYARVASFRPWLRDEFSFRCTYCLLREQWGRVQANYDLDHFVPVTDDPGREHDYDNLVYACASCNAAKSYKRVHDRSYTLVENEVVVHADGRIEAKTAAAQRLIEALGLDSDANTEFRRTWIDIVVLARRYDPDLYQRLMSYPDDLPDLLRLRPPGGNSRPEGVRQSCFMKRKQGELDATY